MYGPVDGSGFVDVSFAGALAGTGAANSVARMFVKSPCGRVELDRDLAVLSSVVMPLMWPDFGFFAKRQRRRCSRRSRHPASRP